ncbi:MAG: hypothetical protein RBS56_04550 [Candidatus Gracilibacteria bacterium]|nr:hypothetical protein [Candidatus Gracilibacteria bacterium]
MIEKFSLEDLEKIESDEEDQLKPVLSDEDGEFFEFRQALPDLEDGIKPMTDETSRGYFDFSQREACVIRKSHKFSRNTPSGYDTERIKSGLVMPSRSSLELTTRQIRLKCDKVLNSDTKNPFDRNAEEVKTRKIKKTAPKTDLNIEEVDDFARRLLEAVRNK